MSRLFVLLLFGLAAGCAEKSSPPPRAIETTSVTYPAGEETARGELFRPATEPPFPAVIVVHNDSGLTPAIKDNARRLAEKGYLVLAVDLYRGEKVKDDVEEAHIMDRAMPEERTLGDLRAAASFLTGHSDVRPGGIGIVGWGSGGGYALDAAVADDRVRAVVTCYGRLRTTPEGLKGLKAPVLGIFAGKDEGIAPETIAQFKQAMSQAGKRLAGAVTYAGSDHGFLELTGKEVSNPSADVLDVWVRIEAFLAAELPKE
jgi:carboxymethylenebutenolidase